MIGVTSFPLFCATAVASGDVQESSSSDARSCTVFRSGCGALAHLRGHSRPAFGRECSATDPSNGRCRRPTTNGSSSPILCVGRVLIASDPSKGLFIPAILASPADSLVVLDGFRSLSRLLTERLVVLRE